mmetsp:Transcript_8493/g.24278  ORF Transcript_8493/g.24278 Transcript_8493/m.24278 type:complete len:100 (-) Transcript_8493:449-748(-)
MMSSCIICMSSINESFTFISEKTSPISGINISIISKVHHNCTSIEFFIPCSTENFTIIMPETSNILVNNYTIFFSLKGSLNSFIIIIISIIIRITETKI